MMTDEELSMAEELWRRGLSARQIGNAMGYAESSIITCAYRNRDRFPLRRRPVDEEKMSRHITLVLAGRETVAAAVKAMGISRETMRRRLKEARNGKA